MIADQQTHALPTTPEGFARLAAFMGGRRGRVSRRPDRAHARVAALTEGFFAPAKARAEPALSPGPAEIVARWPTYPALRSDRGARIFRGSAPRSCAASRPSTGRRGAGPSRRLPRGPARGRAALRALRGQPPAHRPLPRHRATAPGSRLPGAQRAGLRRGDRRRLLQPLARARGAARRSGRAAGGGGGLRAQLDAARRWRKEWHFRIGVHHLRGLIDARRRRAQYADLAGAVLAALWPRWWRISRASTGRRRGAARW
jgi:[glutamine synthetase] adenylyltransferase / [glutamine synthetase]-adenylyl-L-tyrosine phosphorylase